MCGPPRQHHRSATLNARRAQQRARGKGHGYLRPILISLASARSLRRRARACTIPPAFRCGASVAVDEAPGLGLSSSLTLTFTVAVKGGVSERNGVGGSAGAGGVPSMNQSWYAMRNSSSSWLSRCSEGESPGEGCDINPGQKITARSVKGGPRVIKPHRKQLMGLLCTVIRFLSVG